MEERFKDRLDRGLLVQMWIGGSFASTKLDPRNIDVTLFIDVEQRNKLSGLEGSGKLRKLMKSRDRIARNYGVSPMFVDYRAVANVFQPDQMTTEDRDYFLGRGIWDDWWQRTRSSDDQPPTHESAASRRGYLEVRLR